MTMTQATAQEPSAVGRYLRGEIERLTQEIEQQQRIPHRVSYEGNDDQDLTVMLLEQTTNRAVVEQRQRLLQQMQSAYQRLETGTYGVCEDCHTAILPERLEALPWATLCVTCQGRRERLNGRGRA